jgi:hypothetical protein
LQRKHTFASILSASSKSFSRTPTVALSPGPFFISLPNWRFIDFIVAMLYFQLIDNSFVVKPAIVLETVCIIVLSNALDEAKDAMCENREEQDIELAICTASLNSVLVCGEAPIV